jgi:hypothetical protein
MIKILTTIAIALTALCATAQFKPQVIASTGAYVAAGPLEISYTVGEMSAVITTGNVSGLHLTQGFHQPEEVAVLTGLNEQKPAEVNFALYPNPTARTIWVGYKMPNPGKVSLNLYSVNGQMLQNLFTGDYIGGSDVNHYDVSGLATGNYLLSVQFTTPTGQTSINSKQFSITQ